MHAGIMTPTRRVSRWSVADANGGAKMDLSAWFKRFSLERVSVGPQWANAEISFNDDTNRDAAWELYIEMLTRIVTQPLPAEDGDEKTAKI